MRAETRGGHNAACFESPCSALALAPTASFAQSNQSPSIVLPTVIVTAQKEAADVKEVPASVTAVTAETITDSGLRAITDAAIFAPNTVFTEFTARKVSNARFRGIGSSPANPAITTYLDGVPQLNSNSSNIELLDVGQIEFVRGPQSPLFGRNTLGGIVNVTTARPSMSAWTGAVIVPFGNAGLWEARGNVSGPVGDKAAIGFAAGKQQRDGFTQNSITGNDLDSRDGTFAKAQALFLPNANWEARVIYAHERDRDGDYALGDLSAIRIAPFRVARDYEGFTNRDINNTTVNLRGTGQNFAIESTTGFIKWKTEDETDLDYSPLPLATRIEPRGRHAVHAGGPHRVAGERAARARIDDDQVAGGHRVLQPGLRSGCGEHVQRVRAESAGRLPGRDALAGSVDRQQRRRPVRARHVHASTTRPT